MSRPNVTIKTIDESLVAPIGETQSSTRGAMVSLNGLIDNLGTTAEQNINLMVIENLSEWSGRLRTYAENRLVAESGFAGVTLFSAIGACAAGYIDSNTSTTRKAWHKEWWAMHNYLQYGGVGIIGSTSDTLASLLDPTQTFDVIFQGGTLTADETNLKTVVEAKRLTDSAVIGVVSNTNSISNGMSKVSSTADEFYINVWGNKYHLNGFGTDTGETSSLILSNLSPDVAGCLARTDREAYSWISPAGRRRGRILNVVRLHTNPTNTQQDYLYDAGINPVVTFPGEGTILFGDKTGQADTSTLSRINVSRLFIYLRKVIAPIARGILFEINDATTQTRFRMAADNVLRNVLGSGGISDYRIICDSSNNTPDLVQSRIFVADILVKPAISINFIRITFTNKNLTSDLGG